MEKYTCSECLKTKDISRFYKNGKNRAGYRTICRDCDALIYASKKNNTFIRKTIQNIDGEVWKDILDFELKYQVSNFGRVKSNVSTMKEKILKHGTTDGYTHVTLVNNEFKHIIYRIHRLVAMAFIPNPENKPHINHINGIRNDNNVNNLEWCTRQENHDHAFRTGLNWNVGEHSVLAKLSEKNVFDILNSNKSVSELSSIYNITDSAVRMILNGKNWGYITGIEYKPKNKIGENTVISIFNSNLSTEEICNIYNVSKIIVWNIKSGRNYSKLTGKEFVKKYDIKKSNPA